MSHTICSLNYKLFPLTIQSFREKEMCPRGMNNSSSQPKIWPLGRETIKHLLFLAISHYLSWEGAFFFFPLLFLKRFIFRLVTKGWQNAGKLKVLQSRPLGQCSKPFQGKTMPPEPRNLFVLQSLSKEESRDLGVTNPYHSSELE